jgi:imidazolonepropionase-like amidohydrolase
MRFADPEALSGEIPMRRLLAIALALLAGCAAPPVETLDVEAYTGATLVDGTGAAAVEDAVLVVREGIVQCAGDTDRCSIPATAELVDLSGAWVTPGLIDAHVHFAQTAWADGRPDGMNVTEAYPYAEVVADQRRNAPLTYRSYLCSGVTGVFDVGGFPWSWELRDDDTTVTVPAGEGTIAAPHVAAAGPLLTWVAPRMSLPAEQVMVRFASGEDGREGVRYMAAWGSDAVKVWLLGVPESVDQAIPSRQEVDAWVAAIGQEAASHGLPLIVHATSLREAKVAVRAGASLLVHSVQSEPVDEEFLTLARDAGTIYTPTLIVSENWWAMSKHAFSGEMPIIDDPNGCVDPGTRAKIESTPQYREHPNIARLTDAIVAGRDEAMARGNEIMAENLRRVHEAGITIAMGTDAGNPFTVHGPSVYAEMERMQAAGLAPADIVVMATRNGARAMGRADEIGTLEPGKIADFLVLDADPLADVSAFRSVRSVARSGNVTRVRELSFAGSSGGE